MRRIIGLGVIALVVVGLVAAPAGAKKKHHPKRAAATTSTSTSTTTTTTLATVQPQHFEGSGDGIVDLPAPLTKPVVIHVVGNSGARYFGVTPVDSSNTPGSTLVNTTDVYDGHVLYGVTSSTSLAHFQVKAIGNWSIDVADLSTARRINSPGSIDGGGDDVFIVTPGKPSRAHIAGNQADRYFGVIGYNTSRNTLVNTTDPYDGTVLVPSTANLLFEVKATGAWHIDFS